MADDNGTDWQAVIARTLAFLSLRAAGREKEPLTDQAAFLERFGLPRAEAARLLGSSPASLRVMAGRKKKRGKSRGQAAKKTSRKKSSRRAR